MTSIFPACTITVELESESYSIDAVDYQLAMDSAISSDQSQSVRESIEAVKSKFKSDFNIELATSQAWLLANTVTRAFLAYKKKFDDSLMSLSGMELMPPHPANATSSFYTQNFPDNSPNSKS